MAREAKRHVPDGPMDRLKSEASGLVGAAADRALSSVLSKAHDAVGRLGDVADGNGAGLAAALTGAKDMAEGKGPVRSLLGAGMSATKKKAAGMFGGGKGKKQGGGNKKLKLTSIVETIDVGVPVRLAYDQWNQFGDFPKFMKKVEQAERAKEDDTKVNWKAQVFWSHRNWESTITDQRPDERVIWRSKGPKGYVDGAVTFHELGPRLTRILLVLEYHPQGMFEGAGNLWRAQGRRARLELKHFARHVMTNTALHPDEIEGWRGVIEDGEVVKDHETALDDEAQEQDEARGQEDRDLEDRDLQDTAEEDTAETEDQAEDWDEDELADEEQPEDEDQAEEELAARDQASRAEEDRDQGRGRRRPADRDTTRGRPRPAPDQRPRRAQGATRTAARGAARTRSEGTTRGGSRK
jgi:uncharacterized membrane protein